MGDDLDALLDGAHRPARGRQRGVKSELVRELDETAKKLRSSTMYLEVQRQRAARAREVANASLALLGIGHRLIAW